MAKKPLVHCRICKGEIDRNTQQENVDWVMPTPKWYYHKHCYETWAKKKNDIHASASAEEWFDMMWQYLSKDIKIGPDYTKTKSQWDNFIKKGYTPKGIYFSVRYQYEVNHGDPKKSEGGIGIVPHIYQNCSAYWQKRENEFKDICSRIEKQMQEIKEKKVKEVAYVQRDRKKKKLLSLSDIMEGEE
jgi:hypothetical protein